MQLGNDVFSLNITIPKSCFSLVLITSRPLKKVTLQPWKINGWNLEITHLEKGT